MATIQQGVGQKVSMGYLVEFEQAIENHDAPKLLRLWEEYTSTDEVDPEDFLASLQAIQSSELHDYVGRHIERAIPLWKLVEKGPLSDEILRLIVDLEVTNPQELRDITIAHLEEKYKDDPLFNEKMRLINLRGKPVDFRGAISHYILLNHLKPGNFVFHSAGWGVGEIIDVSMIREQTGIEFDYTPGKKDISFKVAFATLTPIPETHFLAQRFGDADALEEKAKAQPLVVMHELLRDLGPRTAAEIKDELCELVIPEKEWNRWWQATRAKLKKDTQVQNPADTKGAFRLLKEGISHEERLKKFLESKPTADKFIQTIYSFIKDFPETLKNATFKETLGQKVQDMLAASEHTVAQELQMQYFLQDLGGKKDNPKITQLLQETDHVESLLSAISILAFKKRTLVELRRVRADWAKVFIRLLFAIEENTLRDYIVQELLASDAKEQLHEKLNLLCDEPEKHPEMIIWYFQKCLASDNLPHSTKLNKPRVFEAFLVTLGFLEQQGDRRDLIKKMHNLLSADRYKIVRDLMKLSTLADVQEFLLLITKCHSLTDHEIKVFYSLAEVAHPELKRDQDTTVEADNDVIWTTHEGYTALQKKIEHIGTIETVENAKEIEVARAHGDLRENAEFKAALERRDRLQAELKMLSEQLSKSRILTAQDFDANQVNVGAKVKCASDDGQTIEYTLLGPWDADPEKNILSFQSKLAKSMIGLKVGDSFEVQGKTWKITELTSAIKG